MLVRLKFLLFSYTNKDYIIIVQTKTKIAKIATLFLFWYKHKTIRS